MALTWPDIAAPSRFEEIDFQHQLESESEAGYVTTRAAGTAAKTGFKLGWDRMTSEDKAVLKAFVRSGKGQLIDFVHFDTSETHTVVIRGNDVTYKWNSPDWVVDLVLREV